jgi:glycosyltransferase involved in cell wall biosynthesis
MPMAQQDNPAADASAAGGSAPCRIWHYNQKVYHYRVPIWDGLTELGAGKYTLKVLGETIDGEALGGGKRDYIQHNAVVPGRFGERWDGAEEAIRREKPDIVVFNSTPRYASSWTLPKLVRSYGGVAIAWTKSHSYTPLPKWVLHLMKRRLMSRYDFVIAYGQSTYDELLTLGVRDSQIFIAQNTIDTRPIFEREDEFRKMGEDLRQEHGLVGKKILLDLGRMDPQKRHEDLFAAWPKMRELDPDLVLVLVGGGPSLEDYKRMAQQIDPERIIVTGRVPLGHDYAWIAAADVAIQCGAVGLAINQAMAFKTPNVIADQLGVDTELIVHGETGWRFKEGDLDGMVAAVKHVLTSPDQREQVLARARTVVRDEANLDNMIQKIDACLVAAINLRLDRKRKQ